MSESPKDEKNTKETSKSKEETDAGNAGMNILKRIIASIRAESRELTEAVMDSGGSGKIELAYESAKFKLNEAKSELTDMLRKEQQASRIIEITDDKIKRHESQIADALAQNDETGAMKYALLVVDLELDREFQFESKADISTNVLYLERQLEQSERDLKSIARQLSMLKTTEKVQKATDTIMEHIDGADENMLSAKKSLNHIREKQKNSKDLHATEEQIIKDYKKGKAVDKAITDSKNNADKVISRIQQGITDRTGGKD